MPSEEIRIGDVRIVRGLSEGHRMKAADLYLQAFGQKLGPILGKDHRASGFLAHVMRPTQALMAVDASDQLLGLAGFHNAETGLIGGDLSDLVRFYGWIGAIWRALALSLFERGPTPGEFLMDGIVVAPAARGLGVGSALLAGILETARSEDAKQVRLDVIDANPRAKALYERTGFVAGKVKRYGVLTRWLGFSAVTTMTYRIARTNDT